jgi:hypothetical protein
MTVIRKRKTGYNVSERQAENIKNFNNQLRYVQGFKASLAGNGSTTPVTISLTSSGRQLLGISIMPTDGTLTALADTQLNFVVNNNNMLLNAGANNLNPNFVQNMMFFPTPQPLVGTDSMSLQITKNDAGAVSVIINVYYVPQAGV